MIELGQREECRSLYRRIFATDERGTALDIDSLNIANVVVGVAKILALDLYDLLDVVQEDDFVTEARFLDRLPELAQLAAGARHDG